MNGSKDKFPFGLGVVEGNYSYAYDKFEYLLWTVRVVAFLFWFVLIFFFFLMFLICLCIFIKQLLRKFCVKPALLNAVGVL